MVRDFIIILTFSFYLVACNSSDNNIYNSDSELSAETPQEDTFFLYKDFYYGQSKNSFPEAADRTQYRYDFDNPINDPLAQVLYINGTKKTYFIEPYFYNDSLTEIRLTSEFGHKIDDIVNFFTKKYGKPIETTNRELEDCRRIPKSMRRKFNALQRLNNYETLEEHDKHIIDKSNGTLDIYNRPFCYIASPPREDDKVYLSDYELSTIPHYNCDKYNNNIVHVHLYNKRFNCQEEQVEVEVEWNEICNSVKYYNYKWVKDDKKIEISFFERNLNELLRLKKKYPFFEPCYSRAARNFTSITYRKVYKTDPQFEKLDLNPKEPTKEQMQQLEKQTMDDI